MSAVKQSLAAVRKGTRPPRLSEQSSLDSVFFSFTTTVATPDVRTKSSTRAHPANDSRQTFWFGPNAPASAVRSLVKLIARMIGWF